MGLGISITVNGSAEASLAEATLVEVYQTMYGWSQYFLHYDIDVVDGDIPMLTEGKLDPDTKLGIQVPTDEETVTLVQGPVTGQNIDLRHGGQGSTLIVNGADTLITLDRDERIAQYDGVTESGGILSLVKEFGLTPDVESTEGTWNSDGHTLLQRGTPYQFIKKAARRNGCYFWVEADAAGVETFYFKRPMLEGKPVAELIINLDTWNIGQLSLEWDVERPNSADGAGLDLKTLGELSVSAISSPLPPLGGRDLPDVAGREQKELVTTTVDDSGMLESRVESILVDSGWFVKARCVTTLEKLGKVLRSHQLVKLRGAGSRHSGLYYVSAVTHKIDAVSHQMEIELLRNAWEA